MKPAALITTIMVITLGIVDLCFVTFGGVDSSVSQFLIHVGFHSPVFVFAVGFTLGHCWGFMIPVDKP